MVSLVIISAIIFAVCLCLNHIDSPTIIFNVNALVIIKSCAITLSIEYVSICPASIIPANTGECFTYAIIRGAIACSQSIRVVILRSSRVPIIIPSMISHSHALLVCLVSLMPDDFLGILIISYWRKNVELTIEFTTLTPAILGVCSRLTGS